MKPTQLE